MKRRARFLPLSRWSASPRTSPSVEPDWIESGNRSRIIQPPSAPASASSIPPKPVSIQPVEVLPPAAPANPAPSISPAQPQVSAPSAQQVIAVQPPQSVTPPGPPKVGPAFSKLVAKCSALADEAFSSPRKSSASGEGRQEYNEPVPPPRIRRRSRASKYAGRAAVRIRDHEKVCTICNHPEMEAIEEAFLQWCSIQTIRFEFKIPSRSSIYRHAHAFGLFEKRKRSLSFCLEHIMENADRVQPTAEGVIQAVRAYTRINSSGEWIERPTHIIVSAGPPVAPNSRQPGMASSTVSEVGRLSPTTQVAARIAKNLVGTHVRAGNDASR